MRETLRLRSLLREFFPAALQAFPTLHGVTATTVLAAAPTPTAAATLTEAQLQELLRAAHYSAPRATPARPRATLTAPQLRQPPAVEAAMGLAVAGIVRGLAAMLTSIKELEKAMDEHFARHPDAQILRSLPGLGVVLGARVLGEFGDDPTRFVDAAGRRAYAGTAPITRASGKTRAVLVRHACNRRLCDACRSWAFTATQHSAPAKAYYGRRRAAGDGHEAALRRVANKLLGQLHHCLTNHVPYDEQAAWSQHPPAEATA